MRHVMVGKVSVKRLDISSGSASGRYSGIVPSNQSDVGGPLLPKLALPYHPSVNPSRIEQPVNYRPG